MCHTVVPAMANRGRGAIANNVTVEAFARSLAVDVAQHRDTPQTAERMLRGREPGLIGRRQPQAM